MSESWLDVMSWEVSLARAVPVVVDGYGKAVVFWVDGPTVRAVREGGEILDTYHPLCLVDLDDPQGFAYALQYAWKHFGPALEPFMGRLSAALTRWRQDRITDTDRLALARALREIHP